MDLVSKLEIVFDFKVAWCVCSDPVFLVLSLQINHLLRSEPVFWEIELNIQLLLLLGSSSSAHALVSSLVPFFQPFLLDLFLLDLVLLFCFKVWKRLNGSSCFSILPDLFFCPGSSALQKHVENRNFHSFAVLWANANISVEESVLEIPNSEDEPHRLPCVPTASLELIIVKVELCAGNCDSFDDRIVHCPRISV